MIDQISADGALVAVGLFGGILLGLSARLGRFCTLGALEDFHFGGSSVRLRMWGVALGASMLLVFGASGLGLVDTSRVIYLMRAPDLAAAAVGGLTFGLGMALAGNCGFGALARMAGGEIRSFVIVVVMGLAALATASGPLSGLRRAVFPPEVADRPAGYAELVGGALDVAPWLVGMTLGALVIVLAARGAGSRSVWWGLPVAVAIGSGFVGSALTASRSFDAVPVLSHSFSAPLGETMIWLMLSSGISPGFGVGSVFGVLIGALAGSRIRGVFRWEACDDHRELRRQLGGAVLMGVGAVVAFGCSVGQGLSAFSVLAITAPVTLGCIWLGGWLGLKLMLEGRAVFFRA